MWCHQQAKGSDPSLLVSSAKMVSGAVQMDVQLWAPQDQSHTEILE